MADINDLLAGQPDDPDKKVDGFKRGYKCSVFFTGINRVVKNTFKAWCARHNVSMTKEIESFMRRRSQEDKP